MGRNCNQEFTIEEIQLLSTLLQLTRAAHSISFCTTPFIDASALLAFVPKKLKNIKYQTKKTRLKVTFSDRPRDDLFNAKQTYRIFEIIKKKR